MQKKKNLKLFYMAYIILGLTIPIFDPLYPYFSKNFNVGYDKIGILFFFGSLTAIISIFIAGIISDKIPLRKIFLSSFAITFIGFAIFNIFQNFIGLIITVIIVNIGTIIFWPAVYAKVFYDHNENYSTMYVKLDRFYYLATALGPLLISLLLYLKLSPRYVFSLLLVLFLILFIAFYINYRDKTSNTNDPSSINYNKINYNENPSLVSKQIKSNKHIANDKENNIKSFESSKIYDNDLNNEKDIITKYDKFNHIDNKLKDKPHKNKKIKQIIRRIKKFFTPAVIFANLLLMLFSGVLSGTSAWLTTYFTSYNIAVSFSSIFVSIYWIFTFVGLQITSKLLEFLNEEKILFFGGIFCIISLVCFSLFNIVFVKIIFLCFVGISISGIYALSGAITVRENPKMAGTASGFSIGMGLVGTLIVQPIMGFVAQYHSKTYIPYVLIVLATLGTIMAAILLKIYFNNIKKLSLINHHL
jgi:MFS family permease